jgi:hypothetical protein
VSATRDGRTLAALAFAGHRQAGAAYRLSQAASAAFVTLDPASTLALAAFLKRIKALTVQLTVPETRVVTLNALPFLLAAYEQARRAATDTLVAIAASAEPGGGRPPDLGGLSPAAEQVLRRFLSQLLTAVQPEGDIALPPEVTAAITAPDSPLRQAAEAVLVLLNEAAGVAAEEAGQSPPPSLAPDAWLPSPASAVASPLPDPPASDAPEPVADTPAPSPTPGTGRRSGVNPVPEARLALDLARPLARAHQLPAEALALPVGAGPGGLVLLGGLEAGLVYLDTVATGTPAFDPHPASLADYPVDPHPLGIPRDVTGLPLAAAPARRVVEAPSGALFLADASQVIVRDGGATSVFLAGLDHVTDLAVDGTHVYVAEGGSGTQAGRVRRVDLADPTASATLLEGTSWPAALAVDGTHVYVVEHGTGFDGALTRVPLSGGAPEVLATGQPLPTGLVVTADLVFFTAGPLDAQGLRVVPKAGGVVGLYQDLGGAVVPRLVADASHVYVLTRAEGALGAWTALGLSPPPVTTLVRFPLAGGPPSLLATFPGDEAPLGLQLNATHAFVSFPTGGVWRVPL